MNPSMQKTNVTLSLRERFCFACGNLGYQTTYYWVTAFLMIFYTDIMLVPAASISVLMLVVRIYDAVNDPIIGSLMDRTKSPLGRYRPWILVGGIGLALSSIMMFTGHLGWSLTSKTIYMYASYILVTTFSTMFYMAYMALNGCMTSNSLERAKASSWREMFSFAGMLIVGYVAPYMISFFGSGTPVKGYFYSILICAAISIPLILTVTFGTKERIHVASPQAKVSMKQQWDALLKNKPMLILVACMTLHGVQMNGRLTVAAYFCTYMTDAVGVFAMFNLLNSLMAVFGCMVAPSLVKRMGNKGKASAAILFLCAISMIAQYVTPVPSFHFYFWVSVTGFCYGTFSALMFGMIPDAVDFAQAKFKVRVDGFLGAVASFGFKLGGAVSTALIGAVLNWCGYVPNVTQNTVCLNAINLMMTVVPGILCVVAAICLLAYPINAHMHEKILQELNTEG